MLHHSSNVGGDVMVTVDLTNVRLTFLKQNIHVTVKAFPSSCIAVQNDSFLFRSSSGATFALCLYLRTHGILASLIKQSSLQRLLPTCVQLMKRRRFFVPVRNTIVVGISKHLP